MCTGERWEDREVGRAGVNLSQHCEGLFWDCFQDHFINLTLPGKNENKNTKPTHLWWNTTMSLCVFAQSHIPWCSTGIVTNWQITLRKKRYQYNFTSVWLSSIRRSMKATHPQIYQTYTQGEERENGFHQRGQALTAWPHRGLKNVNTDRKIYNPHIPGERTTVVNKITAK